jgi:hypothetical protein
MSPIGQPAKQRGTLDAPAQWYAAVVGVFLLALGILSLIIDTGGWGGVGNVSDQPQFIIWATSGWTCIFWIVMGALGLFALTRADRARTYALVAGVVFAVVAIWGFIDGNNVFGIFAADTTNNITHAIIAGLGLLIGLMPLSAQRPQKATGAGHPAT